MAKIQGIAFDKIEMLGSPYHLTEQRVCAGSLGSSIQKSCTMKLLALLRLASFCCVSLSNQPFFLLRSSLVGQPRRTSSWY